MADGGIVGRHASGVARVALIGLASFVVALLTGCGGSSQASQPACAEEVVKDWSADGRIDGLYPSNCYLAAIEILPEDVRTYSSAADDISRALQSREASPSAAETGANRDATDSSFALGAASSRRGTDQQADGVASDPSHALRRPPLPLLVIVGVFGVVAASGSAAFVLRRLRYGR